MEDPLLEVAISYAQDCHHALTDDETRELTEIFNSFLKGEISKDDTSLAVEKIVGSSQSVEKIDAILQITDDPIPVPSNESNPRPKSKPWSQYEDQRLLAGIHKLGLESWNNVAAFVGNGRTRSQCSQRWNRGLNPKISKTCWSKDEEARLISYVEKYGERAWTKIASEFGNRSDVQCRYRYQQLSKETPLIEVDDIPEGPVSCPPSLSYSHSTMNSPQTMNIQKANSLSPNPDLFKWKQEPQPSSLFAYTDMMNLPPPIYQNNCFQQMEPMPSLQVPMPPTSPEPPKIQNPDQDVPLGQLPKMVPRMSLPHVDVSAYIEY